MITFTITADTVETRIVEERAERHLRLVREAHRLDITVAPDDVQPGAWIARQPDIVGGCEIVTVSSCTCRRFRTWARCPHHALVQMLEGVEPDAPAVVAQPLAGVA
jgi:hypothetical protein